MKLRGRYGAGLVLVGALGWGMHAAIADSPCPWQGEADKEICARWETINRHIEEAAQQAEQAAKSLQSLPAGASAATVEPGSPEARARAIIDRFLQYLPPPTDDMGGFEIDRNYAFTAEGNGLITHIAKAAWVRHAFRADFGPLQIRIEPGDGGLSKVDFRLNDVVTLREGEKTLARVLIGEQQSQGVWDEAAKAFSQSDMQLGKIELALEGEPVIASLAKASMKQVLKRDAQDNWRSRQDMAFEGLQIRVQDYAATLASATGYAEMDGREYQKLPSSGEELNTLLGQENLEEEEAVKQFLRVVENMYSTFTRLDSEFIASDLVVGDPAQPLAKAAKITFGGHYAEADGGSTFGYIMGVSGLATQNPGLPPELIPTDARMEVGLFNITAETVKKFMEVAMAAEKLPEAEQDAYLDQQLAQLFMNSHLGAYMKDSFVATPATRLDMNFRATVDAQSAKGGVGEFKLRIEGLDQAVAATQTMPGQESAAPLLGMLMAFSSRTQEGDKVVDTFDVKLGADGKLFLNGKDVTAMFMPPESVDTNQPPDAQTDSEGAAPVEQPAKP